VEHSLIDDLPERKGSSENQAVGNTMSRTPTTLASETAGSSNSMSKQVNIPNVTPKSVSKTEISASGVVLKPSSPNKWNLRYLECRSKSTLLKLTIRSVFSPLETSRCLRQNNIKMDLEETVCVGVGCPRQGPLKGTCEQGNKTHSAIRREEYFSLAWRL
jgi:hypothetical protein